MKISYEYRLLNAVRIQTSKWGVLLLIDVEKKRVPGGKTPHLTEGRSERARRFFF